MQQEPQVRLAQLEQLVPQEQLEPRVLLVLLVLQQAQQELG